MAPKALGLGCKWDYNRITSKRNTEGRNELSTADRTSLRQRTKPVLEQRQLLKAMVINAKAANDVELLATLKARWVALKAELV
jgi:hypothetical protein